MMHKNMMVLPLSLVCTLIASCSGAGCKQGNSGTVKSPTTVPNPKDEVIALLKQAMKDGDAWDKRVRSQSDRWLDGQFRGVKHWYKKYPVAYAKERLIARGSVVVPILLEITRDQQQADVHFLAWDVLERLNPSLCLKELYKAGKEGSLSPGQISSLIRFSLPVRKSADYWHEDKVMDWLGKQLAEKNSDRIVLDLMDEFLKAEYAEGGMFPGAIDEQVLRWLNRIYDIDLDAWLAAKAPAVLKFRQEQLSKGYDPATGFDLDQNIANGMLDEAMVAIYPQPEDQKACKELLEAVYPNALPGGVRSPLHPPASPGWEKRLKDWYWSQRPDLRYDAILLRFVPNKVQAGQTRDVPSLY